MIRFQDGPLVQFYDYKKLYDDQLFRQECEVWFSNRKKPKVVWEGYEKWGSDGGPTVLVLHTDKSERTISTTDEICNLVQEVIVGSYYGDQLPFYFFFDVSTQN